MSAPRSPSPPLSTTTSSPSPPRPSAFAASDDDNDPAPPSCPPPTKPPPLPAPVKTPGFAQREDCWSEESTRTLIEAWGAHYLDLNRGSLRQQHWQEVADAVNSAASAAKNLHRTDVQCKNRIDTVKKKYKAEKSKVVESNGLYKSSWPHFGSLDSLIGDAFSRPNNHRSDGHGRNLRPRPPPKSPEKSPSLSPPPPPLPYRRKSTVLTPAPPERSHLPAVPWSVPVGPRSRRAGTGSLTERNFSMMAAAAAAVEAEEEDEEEEEELWPLPKRMRRAAEEEVDLSVGEGYRKLAEAITRLGEMYAKVEEAKQRQMVEMEKQRMQFAKDLEIQRMKLFMESQVQLEKLKRAKQNARNHNYL